MNEPAKQYDPKAHEETVYKKWEAAQAFQPRADASGKPFVIMLPPPNITGTLHMGHALQDTIMDTLIRYHRLKGEPTLWLPGTDHAAIATNRVIEEQLRLEGTSRHALGRAAFMQRVEQWYATTGEQIINQMKRLGASADWSRLRFTMDEDYVKAVNEAFIHYHQQGYLYRGNYIVNWDPQSQTTVSDLEIEWKTAKTPLYTLRYGPFEITTARPETKFGDKYVVMHPADKRYAHYKDGQQFTAEWINGPVTATVIKDEAIDQSFGTGVMTITPWHDAVDFAIAQRHQLDMEQIIDFQGQLLPIAGEFAGMPIATVRPKIIAKLEEKGLIVKVDEKYEHNVALNERGQGVIEPQVMRQWFVNMQKLKGEAIKVVEENTITFAPPRWKKHFLQWMDGLHDWNINRQIWLGHRIPVWWKPGTRNTEQEEGNYVVALERPAGDYEQDPDVLDTWFSSALWPFATLGWPEKTDDLKKFYPTSVLVTARDIMYLWVARMIFSSLEFVKQIPFSQVLIHPTVLTKTGQRMSKSLGTGIDPLELIEKYGADATRFGLLHQMSYDQQAMRFDEAAIVAARNFANKIWNINRFINVLPARTEPSLADEWMTGILSNLTHEISALLDELKVGEAARRLYDFVWSDFADWYVEILKGEGSTTTAKKLFQQLLALLHPFIPHLTEVLWEQNENTGMLITGQWSGEGVRKFKGVRHPKINVSDTLIPDPLEFLTPSLAAITELKDVISTLRRARMLLGLAGNVSIYLETPPAMPAAIAKLGRVEIVPTPPTKAVRFPMSSGAAMLISAPEITAERLTATKEKLKGEQVKIESQLARQRALLTRMQTKATPAVVTKKTTEIVLLEQRLMELGKSVQILEEAV